MNSSLYFDENVNASSSAIILAGGNSKRMNFPKPWLTFSENKTFLEHIIDTYKILGCNKIITVINSKFCIEWMYELNKIKTKSIVIQNHNPEKGRIYSLKLALKHLKQVNYAFIHNVDNPSVKRSTLLKLIKSRPKDGYSVPVYKNKSGHPIYITKNIIEKIKTYSNESTLREILSSEKRTSIHVEDKHVLLNINTTEDYKKFTENFIF